MKLWVDDIRMPPDETWAWYKTSSSTIKYLELTRRHSWRYCSQEFFPELMSLDHDLGGNDTTRPIVLWMCENDFWPDQVVVHSANPVGRDWLEGMIERYKP